MPASRPVGRAPGPARWRGTSGQRWPRRWPPWWAGRRAFYSQTRRPPDGMELVPVDRLDLAGVAAVDHQVPADIHALMSRVGAAVAAGVVEEDRVARLDLGAGDRRVLGDLLPGRAAHVDAELGQDRHDEAAAVEA